MSRDSATRAGLAILSGVALGLAFPKFDLNLLAWVAFVPLFYAIEGEPLKRVLGLAYLQNFAAFVVSLYWIAIPLHSFADVRMELAIVPMLLLAAVLASYGAIAIWAGEYTARRLRIPMVATMPVAWTAMEWVRTYFPIGFPWNLLGYVAYRYIELMQFVEFTGVYGLSALVIFFNAVVFVVALRRGSPRLQVASLIAMTGLMGVLFGFGQWRISELGRLQPEGTLKVAMVQGDIPQSIKWNPDFLPQSFRVYQDSTVQAVKHGVDLIVWPEAAAAFLFQADGVYPAGFADYAAYRDALLNLARTTGDPILFGAPALGEQDGHAGFYNRAYLVSGQGQVVAHYDKIQLVPFGEYVPARELLGYFVNRVVQGFGDMLPGSEQTIFNVKGARLGVLICYESVFPDLTRREVNKGADVLVNITNDAWYGESSAPYQALAMAAMRSAETKVPMVRVANTGISAYIRPTGQIETVTPLFKRDLLFHDVPFRPMRTLYTMVGDLFAEICLALAAIGLLLARLRPRAAAADANEEALSPLLHPNGRGTFAS
jgi:apolipoprotein N-acyltransferase